MDDKFFDNWTTQLRKGLLELCILNSISSGKLYGYEIVKKLRSIEGLVISEGTIYPILSRFKREGLVETTLVESSEGPARKYYLLSKHGGGLLAKMNVAWENIQTGMDIIHGENNHD